MTAAPQPAEIPEAGPGPGAAALQPLPGHAGPVAVLEPAEGWVPLHLGEVWDNRELLYFFVWRDLKVRYRQTLLGVLWAIMQPLASVLVLTVVFGLLVKVPSEGTPYSVYVYAAILPWTLFSKSLLAASQSLVINQAMIRKIYFPRLVLPMAAMVTSLVDFAISFVFLLLLLLYYGIYPTATMVYLPAFLALAFLSSFAVSLWLAALNVRYRDIAQGLPFALQLWFYMTPVIYPSSMIPERYRMLFMLNPMSGVCDGFRWALFGKAPPALAPLAVSAVACVVLLVGGLYFFRRSETTFADLV